MATASPTGNLMAQMLMQKLAGLSNQGGPSPAPGGGGDPSSPGPGGSSPDAAGSALSQQFSGVAGADPEMMVKTLTNMKGMLVTMFNRSAFQLPAVARHIATSMKHIDAAIKESQEAAQTVQTVRSQITNNAALSQPNAGGDTGGGF